MERANGSGGTRKLRAANSQRNRTRQSVWPIWTVRANYSTPKKSSAGASEASQIRVLRLLAFTGATVRSNGIAGAVLKRYAYGYDKAGNRTGEQIDLGVSTATHNDLNQLTSVSASAGPVKFAGSLTESG